MIEWKNETSYSRSDRPLKSVDADEAKAEALGMFRDVLAEAAEEPSDD